MLDVPYSNFSSVDPNLTSLDIYPPSTGANHPILIFVHGGGWSRGDKKYVDAKPEAFNQAGYVFVSVNYRLLPEADIPTQAGDVAQAISWVHEHAASFRGDAEHLFLMGHSAGAHLVSLVSTGSSYLERAGLSLDAITGVVALDTQTYDIPLLMSHNPQAGDLLYRLAFRSDEAFWREVSPIYHVEALCGVPPFIVAYSGQGEGRPEQAERFVQKLKEAGVYSEILPALDKTHLEINQEFGQPDDEVTRAVFTFLSKVLQSTP